MAETELKAVMFPAEFTLHDTDVLFFNTGWKTRYHDDHEQLDADQGVLGGGTRTDPRRHFRNITYQEAIDMASKHPPFLGPFV